MGKSAKIRHRRRWRAMRSGAWEAVMEHRREQKQANVEASKQHELARRVRETAEKVRQAGVRRLAALRDHKAGQVT